jgi:hypothetical protein
MRESCNTSPELCKDYINKLLYLFNFPFSIRYLIMKKILLLKILVGVISLVLLIKFLTVIFFEPWLGRVIISKLNDENRNYIVEIKKLHILIIRSGVEIEGISISSNKGHDDDHDFKVETESVKFKGINIIKAIFRHDIHIGAVTISNSNIKGKIPFSASEMPPMVSPLKIGIGRLLIDKVDLVMKNDSTGQSLLVKEGVFKVYDLLVEKQDTLFPSTIKLYDLEVKELVSVSSENLYSYIIKGISYYAASNTIEIDSLYIQPNYKDYDFTSRYKYQTNRIEAIFSKIYVHDFYSYDDFRTMGFISSYIEIGKMDMEVFRDKRKEFRHLIKPVLQDMLYGYPGPIRIDSAGLMHGNVTFKIHAEEANDPGSISFNEINAKIYKVTNDTVYKTKPAFLEIKADALLMGKGEMTILFKGRLFDRDNTFSLKGTLSNMEAIELNPILEKSAFIYATSGKIDKMNFSCTANNTKSNGELTILYDGLDITVKNRKTDDTTAFRERFISFIANRRILDSNPVENEKVRVGIIDYERDPKRFIFHYCFNSILSGITSSLTINHKKRNK